MSLAQALTVLLRPLGARVVTIRGGPNAGARMRLDLAHEKTFWTGTYEPEVAEVVARLDLGGKRVWDVGAHAGYFSLAFARAGARVLALEANPETAARLRRNVALNDAAVEVVEAAAAPEDGEVSFSVVAGRRRPQSRISETGGTRVAAVTLDGLLDRFGAPDFVKMDIEGAELPALQAAPRLLAARPKLFIEVHRERDKEPLAELLGGYDVRWIGSRILAT